jgi:hypothetical protein
MSILVATRMLSKENESWPELVAGIDSKDVSKVAGLLSAKAGFELKLETHPAGFAICPSSGEEGAVRDFLAHYFEIGIIPEDSSKGVLGVRAGISTNASSGRKMHLGSASQASAHIAPVLAGVAAAQSSDDVVLLRLFPHVQKQSAQLATKVWLQSLLEEEERKNVRNVSLLTKSHSVKVYLRAVDDGFRARVKTAWTAVGEVHILNEAEKQDQKKIDGNFKLEKNRKQRLVGDPDRDAKTASALSTLHGTGGKGKKRRRLARKLGSFVRVSQMVAASDLNEAVDKDDCTSSEDAEGDAADM